MKLENSNDFKVITCLYIYKTTDVDRLFYKYRIPF